MTVVLTAINYGTVGETTVTLTMSGTQQLADSSLSCLCASYLSAIWPGPNYSETHANTFRCCIMEIQHPLFSLPFPPFKGRPLYLPSNYSLASLDTGFPWNVQGQVLIPTLLFSQLCIHSPTIKPPSQRGATLRQWTIAHQHLQAEWARRIVVGGLWTANAGVASSNQFYLFQWQEVSCAAC